MAPPYRREPADGKHLIRKFALFAAATATATSAMALPAPPAHAGSRVPEVLEFGIRFGTRRVLVAHVCTSKIASAVAVRRRPVQAGL